ncbi:APC family permease [Arthrobacter sp. NPDC058127]|uniref:APC family permease n=1 Tax=Arthrobacter sp. NPDC058127 TaxID=3346351 RepID=UPI0036EDE74A
MLEETRIPTEGKSTARRLTGSLGPGAVIFMVVAAAAPLTTVGATVPVALTVGNGPAFPIMYVVGALILGLFAVGFIAMSPFVPSAGAFYAYVTRGIGRRCGLGAAFLALLVYTTVQVAVHAFMGAVLQGLTATLGGPDLPWWLWSLLSVAVVGFLGYRNIDLSSKVLGVLLVVEVMLCLLIGVLVLFRGGGPEGMSTAAFTPSEIFSGSPALGLMFAISGFIGFEATAIYRDEARDPARTIPRATYGALLLIGVFYAFVAWTMVSAWGDAAAVARAESQPESMLADTASIVMGPIAKDILQWVLIGSVFACVLSFHNVIARYLFALGQSGALPRALGKGHATHNSPHIGSMVQTGSAVLLIVLFASFGLDPVAQVFTWLVGIATVGILALMLLTCLAVLVFFAKIRDPRLWKTKVAPGLGFLGLLMALWITVANLPLLVGDLALGIIVGLLILASFASGWVVAAIRPSINIESSAERNNA